MYLCSSCVCGEVKEVHTRFLDQLVFRRDVHSFADSKSFRSIGKRLYITVLVDHVIRSNAQS